MTQVSLEELQALSCIISPVWRMYTRRWEILNFSASESLKCCDSRESCSASLSVTVLSLRIETTCFSWKVVAKMTLTDSRDSQGKDSGTRVPAFHFSFQNLCVTRHGLTSAPQIPWELDGNSDDIYTKESCAILNMLIFITLLIHSKSEYWNIFYHY